jgi:hypothetical protein
MKLHIRALNLNSLSLKQRILHLFRVSHIIHFYRVHIKSNAVSIAYKYTYTKELLLRHKAYRVNLRSYKGLKDLVTLRIRLKKIDNAWEANNYQLFVKLNLLFIFAWPIWLIKKLTITYLWLKPYLIKLKRYSKSFMLSIMPTKK